MTQLPLTITPRLSYDGERFVLHSGVSELVATAESALLADPFAAFYISGSARSGKSHLLLHLTEKLSRSKKRGVFLEGEEALAYCTQRQQSGENFGADEVVLIDNFDHLVSGLTNSGAVVELVELLRVSRTSLAVCSAIPLESLGTDAHVNSRFKAGQLTISQPAREDLPQILRELARQRGIKLNQRTISFIEKRIACDLATIEQYLERVELLASRLGKPIDYTLLGDAL